MPQRSDRLAQILEAKLVPAVRTRNGEQAMRALRALYAGGLTVFEIPLTVPDALPILRQAREELVPECLLGIGTVLDAESARAALLSGADFLVSPTLDFNVVAMARRYSVPVFPGALTPTEILAAWQAGADCVKVFPASALGGPAYIKALKGPLPQLSLMPMGGVTLQTAPEYLRAGATLLGVGSDLVSLGALDAGRDSDLTEIAERFVDAVR